MWVSCRCQDGLGSWRECYLGHCQRKSTEDEQRLNTPSGRRKRSLVHISLPLDRLALTGVGTGPKVAARLLNVSHPRTSAICHALLVYVCQVSIAP
jgi:hypothetical protein